MDVRSSAQGSKAFYPVFKAAHVQKEEELQELRVTVLESSTPYMIFLFWVYLTRMENTIKSSGKSLNELLRDSTSLSGSVIK